VLAVVQLALCQPGDLRRGMNGHSRSRELHRVIRQSVAANDADRRQDVDIQRVLEVFWGGGIADWGG
jgi:histidine ammonia-lyase